MENQEDSPVSKVDHIFRSIVDLLRQGVYKPGDKLPNERALADRFDTGRAVVRDALLMVQNQGLIIRRVGSGTYFSDDAARIIETMDAQVNVKDRRPFSFSEILEARLLFEPRVAALASANATPEDMEKLRRRLEDLRRADCWLDFKEAIYAVTKGIYEASGNIFMVSVFDRVIECRRNVNFDGRATQSKVSELVLNQAFTELEVIVEAISRGEGPKAEKLTQDYILRMFTSINL